MVLVIIQSIDGTYSKIIFENMFSHSIVPPSEMTVTDLVEKPTTQSIENKENLINDLVPYLKRKHHLHCSVIGYVSRLFGALLLSIIKSGNFLFTMFNFLLLASRTATNRCLSQISSIVD